MQSVANTSVLSRATPGSATCTSTAASVSDHDHWGEMGMGGAGGAYVM